MTQQDLFHLPAAPGQPAFPLPPATRATNPTSSKIAEEAHTESGARRAHIEIVLDLVREFPGSTYRELHSTHIGRTLRRREKPMESAELQRRLADLSPRREDSDEPAVGARVRRGAPRTCSVTHRPAQTWWPND